MSPAEDVQYHLLRYFPKTDNPLLKLLKLTELVAGRMLCDNFPTETSHYHVPSDHEQFWSHLEYARQTWERLNPCETRRPQFLDVGCGLGSKCLLAYYQNFNVCGIDLCDKYIEFAQHLLSSTRQPYDDPDKTRYEFVHTNAQNYDGYHKFDIIYWYWPVKGMQQLADFEDHILEQARVGTLFFTTHHLFAACKQVQVEDVSKRPDGGLWQLYRKL